MRKKVTRLFCLLTVVICASIAFAQSEGKTAGDGKRASIVIETETSWKNAKKWTLSYIDAMPDGAMNFKPTPEIRSFSEQMLHLAFWNYGLSASITGKPSPYGNKQETFESRDDLKTKAALRKVVEESYDVILAAFAGLDEAKMLEQVSFFNRKYTRLNVLAIAMDHQTHHRAQTTIYLRLKGVTPPPEP
jgi:uncharacterized damage-inducible protein DinB